MLGVTFSIDEITMRFKGNHAFKIRMTYKSEGDGEQTDEKFQKGYKYQIFMCNNPVPKTHLSKIMLPLDARAMSHFDTV